MGWCLQCIHGVAVWLCGCVAVFLCVCALHPQLHLNVGLEKLRDTQTQVAELRLGLEQKEKALEAKSHEAEAKLRQMVSDQNDAEQKKTENEKLQLELAEQNAQIEQRCVVVVVSVLCGCVS